MSDVKPDQAALVADFVFAWYGHLLPSEALDRIVPEMQALIAGFRDLAPPSFDIQAHHFAPLLEALADA
jgi:hypothetical protein